MSDEKLRMQAYYYRFSKTDKRPIDLILSAVACAGKSYHLTEDWLNECQSWTHLRGNTPVDWIQNAAADAAADYDALQARVVELEREQHESDMVLINTRNTAAEKFAQDKFRIATLEATLATTQAALETKEKECEKHEEDARDRYEQAMLWGNTMRRLESERDTALAEAERLRGELAVMKKILDEREEQLIKAHE